MLGLIVAAICPGVAVATDFRVTTTADGDDKVCDAHCTLREAVVHSGVPPDRVILPAGNYVLAYGELTLNNDTIVGENARTTFIDGADKSRVLRVIEVASRVSNVTIRNGNGVGLDSGPGGGIFIHSGSLLLQNSTVSGNTGTAGGGIAAAGVAQLIGVTVSGNRATSGRLTQGGGIAVSSTGGLGLGNSTVSGNTAVDDVGAASQGGGVRSAGGLAIIASTIAGNSASEGGGLYVVAPQTGAISLQNSLLAHGTGGACGGPGIGSLNATANVVSDATCQFKDPSNRQSVSPQAGALADNGGPTNTHALLPSSPAIGHAATCATIDQRLFTRVAPCDSGAYEYRAPTLKAVTQVVNDSGGTRAPSDFTVHVRTGLTDVKGSPQPGSADGTTYTLVAGTSYSVATDAVAGYTLSLAGDCAVTLQEGQNATCTVTATDDPPLAQAPLAQPSFSAQELPPPERGKTVNALPKSGSVRVKLPGSASYVDLDEAEQLPVGTVVDARKGHVTLVAATDDSGGTATAEFWAGIFRLTQTNGTTVLTLVEKLSCPKAGKATVAAKGKKTRRLWGDGSGKFQTKGKHSAATVVGTKWLVEDKCRSTLTRVVRGRVSVRDFVKKKTVIVRAGKKYVARAR